MPQIVEVQGLETVEFPDEMSPDEIKSALDDQFSQQEPAGAIERSARNFARGALGAVAAIPESVAVIADRIGKEFPSIDEGKSLEELATWKAGKAIRNLVEAPAGEKPEGIKGFFTDTFPQGAGSTVGFVAGGMAGRVAKLPAWLAVAASGAAAGGMEQFDDAMNKGADPETAWKSFLIGAGVGTSEAVPISRWLTRVDPQGKLKRALVEGAEDGLQEVFQTVSGNVAAQQMYDPDRPWLQGAGESGATGVTVGGLFSLLFSAAAGRKHNSLANPNTVKSKLENASSPETAKVVAEVAQPEAQGKQPFKGPVKEQPMPDPLAFVNDYGTPQAPQANAATPKVPNPSPERPKYIPPAPKGPVKPELTADPIDPPSPKDNIGPLTEEEKALFQAELDAELGQADTQEDVQPDDIQPNTATAEASQASSEPLPAVETPTEASKQQDAPKAVQAEAVNQATEQAPKPQKAPYITQSNVDEALQTVGEAMKGVDSKLQKLLGEFRVVRLPEGSSGLESAPRSGKNVILVDPIKLKQSIAAGLDLKTGIEEEILHNATGQVVERMRQATAPNVPFRAFWDVTMNRIAEEMSKDLRQNVQRVYGAKLEDTKLAAEYVRRLLQKRLGLSVTEQNYVRQKSPILMRLLESLKELFRNTFGQTIESPSARQMVTQIESLIGETQNGQPNIRADAGGNSPAGEVNGSSPEVSSVQGNAGDAQGSVPAGEAGSGTESGRGQIFEPDRYPDIQLSEDWEKKLHKEVALYVAKNPQISAGDQPAAEGYIHTRARNVAKAWVKDYGSLEAKDASGDKFKLGMVISSRGTNFFNKTQNQKSGGSIPKASMDAQMGEDGDATMHDMVAAPEESEAVRIVREAAALLSKDAKKMYDVAIQDTTNEWMDEWAKEHKTTKRKVKAEWEGIQQSLAKIIAQQGFDFGPGVESSDRTAAANPIDEKYLNAVQSGDMETAQKMVDEAAKAAGYEKRLYHGTRSKWSVWGNDKGGLINLTDDRRIAEMYSKGEGGARARGQNPSIVDSKGLVYDPIASSERGVVDYRNKETGNLIKGAEAQAMLESGDVDVFFHGAEVKTLLARANELDLKSKEGMAVLASINADTARGSEIVNEAKSGRFHWGNTKYEAYWNVWKKDLNPKLEAMGYDSIRFSDDGHDTLAVFNPNQIKSAEPVTRDDQGNVIPLSQRFNTKSEDIRGLLINEDDLLGAAPPQPGGLNVNKDWDAEAKARELTTGQKAARFFKQNKWGAVGYLEDIANRTKNQMAKAAIQKLAKAIPTQLEVTAALHGDLDKDFARFENTHTKARQAEVYAEVARWVAVAQARGTEAAPIKADDAWNDAMKRIYPTLSPEAKSLVDTVQKLGVKKGSIMERLNVHVQEGGKWRPAENLKEKYWPRIIKEEVRIIFGDPEANAETFAKYNALLDQMVAEYPKRFKDRETADAFITQTVKQSVAEGDFYAGAELARGEKLPDSFYDYTLDGYRQANEHFAKRMGQISAYGQSMDDQLDLWQQVEKIATRQGTNENGDRSLKQSLEILRAEMYGTHQHDWSKNTRRFIMALATVRYLSATATMIRNIAGSLVNTSENLGIWNTVKASTMGLMEAAQAIHKSVELKRLVEPASVEKAAALGVIQRSLYFARMFDVDIAETGRFKRVMDVLMLPNQLAEQWNRSVNFTAAQMWLKGATEAIKADPTSYISRARRAQLERWGFTGQKLDALVKGNPSAVKSFLRQAVKEKQYGYSLDQVPVIFNSSIGKFMLQFQRWGAQRTRDMARNILIPAVVGENVDGKKVRNIAPLLRFVAGSLATTAAVKLILEAAFDRKDIQRTWDEVFNSLDKDTKQGVADAISKLLLDLTATGAAGVIPDYLRSARDAIEGGRQKSLSEPPGIAIANDIKDLVTATYQRKGDPQGFVRDLIQILVKRTPLAKEVDDAQMKWILSGTDRAKQNRARNQVRLMKALVNRYAEEKGLEKLQAKRGFQGTKTENSETMDQLYEALLIGDTQAAAKIRREYAVNKAKLQGLMRSVQSRNPLGLMAAKSQRGARQDFLVWLRERRPDAVSGLMQLEATYERTARQVGLLR